MFLWFSYEKKPISTRPGHADAKRPRTEVDVWRHSTHALEPLCRWHWKDRIVFSSEEVATKLAKKRRKTVLGKGPVYIGLPFQVICWCCWMVRLWLTTIPIHIPWWFGVLLPTITTWHCFVVGMFSVYFSAVRCTTLQWSPLDIPMIFPVHHRMFAIIPKSLS